MYATASTEDTARIRHRADERDDDPGSIFEVARNTVVADTYALYGPIVLSAAYGRVSFRIQFASSLYNSKLAFAANPLACVPLTRTTGAFAST